jgi:hypothetical protein
MAVSAETDLGVFWDVLHAALGLQHSASQLAQTGDSEQAAIHEREALSLLLDATCLLGPDEPALATIRTLASAGLARLRALLPVEADSSPAARSGRSASRKALPVNRRLASSSR